MQETETDVLKIEHGLVAQLGERRVRNAEVEGSIPFESTKRGPDEPGNDLFRWSCVRSVPAVAEKAVKKKRHPALWPGAFSYACFVAAASRRSGSIISSMVHPKT